MERKSNRESIFYLDSPRNNHFAVTSYLPPGKSPKGIVIIIPGMAEHAGRYRDFASFLTDNGYGVYAGDHPGQGKTAGSPEMAGRIGGKHNWQVMLENIRTLYTHIRKKQPEAPVFIMGHSMGSLLARNFTAMYPIYIRGLILSGSFHMRRLPLRIFLAFITLKNLFEGADKKSKWLNRLFYGNFNRHFKNAPTLFEWISSDREEVDAYEKDPYCGFYYSNGFYRHLLKGIIATRKAESLLTYRKTLPILILSGQEDPVGHFGKDAVIIHKEFYKQHFQNLSLKIFPGRHELLHEKNKEEIFHYLLQWLDQSLNVR